MDKNEIWLKMKLNLEQNKIDFIVPWIGTSVQGLPLPLLLPPRAFPLALVSYSF